MRRGCGGVVAGGARLKDWGREMNSLPQTPSLLFLATWCLWLSCAGATQRCLVENGALALSGSRTLRRRSFVGLRTERPTLPRSQKKEVGGLGGGVHLRPPIFFHAAGG